MLFLKGENNINFAKKNVVGVWINCIGSISFFIVSILLLVFSLSDNSSIIWISSFFLVGSIVCILANYLFYINEGQKYRLSAGALGTFFGVFIGGILVLLKN